MVPMSNFAPILPLVVPLVPAVPQPVIEFCLRQAAIQICEETRCWRDVVEFDADDSTVTLPVSQIAEVHDVEAMFWNGIKLTPLGFMDSAASRADPREGRPSTFTQVGDGQFIIDPFLAGQIRAVVFLKPKQGQIIGFDPTNAFSDSYNAVPRSMIQAHAMTLALGAVALLCEMPESGAYDPNRAAIFAQRFQAGIDGAKVKSISGQQRAPLRTKSQWM